VLLLILLLVLLILLCVRFDTVGYSVLFMLTVPVLFLFVYTHILGVGCTLMGFVLTMFGVLVF